MQIKYSISSTSNDSRFQKKKKPIDKYAKIWSESLIKTGLVGLESKSNQC